MSSGFSTYNAMSSANSDSFTSFLSWMPFIYFCCLIALVRTSSTKLNKSGRRDILVLFLTIEEETQLFTTEYNASCVLRLIYGLYYVEVCSLSTCNVDSLYHKWMLNFVKCFFLHLLRESHKFYLYFTNVAYHIDWSADVVPLLWF